MKITPTTPLRKALSKEILILSSRNSTIQSVDFAGICTGTIVELCTCRASEPAGLFIEYWLKLDCLTGLKTPHRFYAQPKSYSTFHSCTESQFGFRKSSVI